MRRTALVSALAIAALPTLSSAQTATNAPSYCKAYQPEMVSMNGVYGSYMRVSPDGNYVIVSANGSHILDLTGKDSNGKRVAKIIRTPMNAESYPVEGNWKFITSPGSAISFYHFKDLLEKGTGATPAEIGNGQQERFVDREHRALYYHSAAELPGGDSSQATYRVSLYMESQVRDYKVKFNSDGSVASVDKGRIKPLCQNILKEGQTWPDSMIMQPILSKDGTEMAGLWHRTTHIFKLRDDGTCEVEDDLGIQSYKVSFSYPEPGKRAKIVFTSAGYKRDPAVPSGALTPSMAYHTFSTLIYDPNTKKMTPLSPTWGRGIPNYPGWTKDGRILAQVYDDRGIPSIAVIDPKKLTPVPDLSKLPDNDLAKDCFQDANTYAQAVISIGQVWSSICSSYPAGTEMNGLDQMLALSLEPANCVKMVHENFQTWKDRHPDSTLTEGHLSAACNVSR